MSNGDRKISVNIQDILNSINKYGKTNILKIDHDEFRDNQQRSIKNNSQSKKQSVKQNVFDCTWLPFKFITEEGKEVMLKTVKFGKVITASSAKMPQSTTEESAKNMLIAFREISEEEIMVSGDYAPKKMNTEEEQFLENERALSKAREYIVNTKNLCIALEAIDASYKKCVNQLKKATDLKFTLNKDSNNVKQIKDQFKGSSISKEDLELEKNKVVRVYSIRQSSYEDKETKEEIELKYPLTRIKLMVSKDGQVGTELYDNDKGGYIFTPNVYNLRKLDNKGMPTLAKVKVNGRLSNLTISTAGTFITYRSLVSGVIEFGEIVISKFGISLSNKFKVLYVKRYKTSMTEPIFSPDEFKEMHNSDSESDEDVVVNNENDVSDLEDNNDDDFEDSKPISSKLTKFDSEKTKKNKIKKENINDFPVKEENDSDNEFVAKKVSKNSKKSKKTAIKVKKEINNIDKDKLSDSDAEVPVVSDVE